MSSSFQQVFERTLKPVLKRAPSLIAACVMVLLGAQAYPAKPVRIIVPVGAGGATDIRSRTLGQRLAPVWGQQVVIE